MKLILSLLLLLQLRIAFGQSKNIHEAGKPILVISNDLAQYAINHLQFNAELISKKRNFGFNCYFNKGMSKLRDPATYQNRETKMNPAPDGYGFYKIYYAGADAKFYPQVETKKIKYFYSFGFESGKASCRIEDQNSLIVRPGYYQGNTYYYYSLDTTTTNTVRYSTNMFWGFHHKQGCLWAITKWLYLEAEINLGLNRFYGPGHDSDGKKYKTSSIKYGAGLHLGFAL